MNTSVNEKKSASKILMYIKRFFANDRAGMIVAAIIMTIVFTSLNKNFFTVGNMINILIAGSLMGLVAIGESYLLIAGHVDLSPGSVSAFSGVLIGLLLGRGFGTIASLAAVVLIGVIIGFLNAQLVTKIRLEPFIATLATMQIMRGAAYLINDGKAVAIHDPSFLKLGIGRILGIPIPIWVLIIVIIIFSIILKFTRFGRNIYLIGGNKTASRLAGIDSNKIVTKLYMINSGLSALGGALLASRMNSGHPSASNGLEFDAVTAAILGGIAFSGGVGSLTGTVLGIFVLQGFNNGLQVINVSSFWQYVAKGTLLVVALSFDFLRNRKKQAD